MNNQTGSTVFERTTRTPDYKKDWTSQFSARVDDAMARFRMGESAEEIREIHGAIVTRAAARELRLKVVTA